MIIFIDNKTMSEIENLMKDGYTLASFSNLTITHIRDTIKYDNILMIINEHKTEPPRNTYVGVHDDRGDVYCVERFENIISE